MQKRIVEIVSTLILVLFIFSCSTTKSSIKEQSELQYGVETFDKKFRAWYQQYKKPDNYQQNSYYRAWNKEYVKAWNKKAASKSSTWPFDPVVGYSSGKNYSLELNHKLFYYFMYVENVLQFKILPEGPVFPKN